MGSRAGTTSCACSTPAASVSERRQAGLEAVRPESATWPAREITKDLPPTTTGGIFPPARDRYLQGNGGGSAPHYGYQFTAPAGLPDPGSSGCAACCPAR